MAGGGRSTVRLRHGGGALRSRSSPGRARPPADGSSGEAGYGWSVDGGRNSRSLGSSTAAADSLASAGRGAGAAGRGGLGGPGRGAPPAEAAALSVRGPPEAGRIDSSTPAWRSSTSFGSVRGSIAASP